MTTINDDQAFKQALAGLPVKSQRKLAAQFIGHVLPLNTEPMVARALQAINDESASDEELEEIYRGIKSLTVKSYTACGGDADWASQAAHFVLAATKTCLTPKAHLGKQPALAWKCAMQTRMARTCAMIDDNSDDMAESEAQQQYVLSRHFLAQ